MIVENPETVGGCRPLCRAMIAAARARGDERCALCERQIRKGSAIIYDEAERRHLHLLPSQCTAGGGLSVAVKGCDEPCVACGDFVEHGAVGLQVRGLVDSQRRMHLRCAARHVGEMFRAAEASCQREMPTPHSQVMAMVGFERLGNDDKCAVAVELGGWASGAGYHAASAEDTADTADAAAADADASGAGAAGTDAAPVQQPAHVAQRDGDRPTAVASPAQQSTPTFDSDDEDDFSQGGDDHDEEADDDASQTSAVRPAAQRGGAAAAPAAGKARPSPAATPSSSPSDTFKRPHAVAFDAANRGESSLKYQLAKKTVAVAHFGERARYAPGVKEPAAGEVLYPRREDNAHDRHAIALKRFSERSMIIAYLPKVLSVHLAKHIDSGRAVITSVRVAAPGTRGSKIALWLRLEVDNEELQEQLDFQLDSAIGANDLVM